MKKLKLTALSLGATEVLTRAQLKNVLGGDFGGSGSGSGSAPVKKCKGSCSASVSTPTGTQTQKGSCSLKDFCSCDIVTVSGVISSTCGYA